jgi:aspartate/methionine/tyrosine aminotransferase
LIDHALASSSIDAERAQKCETLRKRAEKVYEVANAPRFRESFRPYPFNSGYFMCVEVEKVPAEQVRLRLLDAYGIGVIAAGASDVRIAFSCLEVDEIEPLFEALHKAIQELM